MPEFEWTRIAVRISHPRTGSFSDQDFYRVWKKGHPTLAAYGASIEEAVASLLNKFGE